LCRWDCYCVCVAPVAAVGAAGRRVLHALRAGILRCASDPFPTGSWFSRGLLVLRATQAGSPADLHPRPAGGCVQRRRDDVVPRGHRRPEPAAVPTLERVHYRGGRRGGRGRECPGTIPHDCVAGGRARVTAAQGLCFSVPLLRVSLGYRFFPHWRGTARLPRRLPPPRTPPGWDCRGCGWWRRPPTCR